MAGHSHSANIKHRKGRVDAKRAKMFSKLAKLIIQAAKNGADPNYNIKLAHAIEKAKSYNMPKDKIENAVKKGSGQLEGYNMEEVVYEGYGPCGIAILIEALTDNRNRTTPEMRHLFEKRNGSLGGPNSVAWKFTPKSFFLVEGVELDEEEFLDIMIEAGMEDYSGEAGKYELIGPAENFATMKTALEENNIEYNGQITKEPNTTVPLDEDGYRKIMVLMDDLDDHEDVQDVYADFDVDEEIIAKVLAD